MSFEQKGIIVMLGDTQQISDTFTKREFVLEIQNGTYKEYPKFQATKDKCERLDAFDVGMEVMVKFNLRGKPYEKEGKTTYFTNLEAWSIESAGNAPKEPTPNHFNSPSAQKQTPPKHAPSVPMFTESEADDLPF